jgi:hypothetical protein
MADCNSKKITELALLDSGSLSQLDLLPIADVSAKQTKAMTVLEMERFLNADLFVNNAVSASVSAWATLAGTANTASWANTAGYAISASYASSGGSGGGSIDFATSASYALHASTADYATEAFHALTADNVVDPNTIVTNALTASYLIGNAATATSASFATYAASAGTVTSASYALTSSYSTNAATASYVTVSGGQVRTIVSQTQYDVTSYMNNSGPGPISGDWMKDSTLFDIPVTTNQIVFIDFFAPYYSVQGNDIAFYIDNPAGSTLGLMCGLDRSTGNGFYYKYFTTMNRTDKPYYMYRDFGAHQNPGVLTCRGYIKAGTNGTLQFYWTKRNNGSIGTYANIYAGTSLIYSIT